MRPSAMPCGPLLRRLRRGPEAVVPGYLPLTLWAPHGSIKHGPQPRVQPLRDRPKNGSRRKWRAAVRESSRRTAVKPTAGKAKPAFWFQPLWRSRGEGAQGPWARRVATRRRRISCPPSCPPRGSAGFGGNCSSPRLPKRRNRMCVTRACEQRVRQLRARHGQGHDEHERRDRQGHRHNVCERTTHQHANAHAHAPNQSPKASAGFHTKRRPSRDTRRRAQQTPT